MKYILAVVFGSIMYGFLPIFSKNLLLSGLSSESIVFYRFFFTLIECVIIILITRKSFKITRRQLLQISFFGIIGVGATALLITLSLNYISTGLANMLHFGYPAVVIIIMTLLYKEKISLYKISAILVALLGLFILTQIKTEGSIKGVILVLITAFTYALYIIANKKSSFASLDTMVILLYTSLAVSVFFFIQAKVTDTFQIPTTLYQYVNIMATALLCTIMSLGLLLYGVKGLGSSTASVLNMFEPTTTVIAGIFLHSETFTINILIGSLLVIFSTVIIVFENMKLKKKKLKHASSSLPTT